jgi:hypothetical protein
MQSSPSLFLSSAGIFVPFQNIVHPRWVPLSTRNIFLNGFATMDSYVFKGVIKRLKEHGVKLLSGGEAED